MKVLIVQTSPNLSGFRAKRRPSAFEFGKRGHSFRHTEGEMLKTGVAALRQRLPTKRHKICAMSRSVRPFAIEKCLRRHIVQLKPYTPIEPFDIVAERIGTSVKNVVKLDANENLYGPPPEVFKALETMPFCNIYPDPETRKLRKALAEWVNVPMEHLLVGCGADELIDLLLRCLLEDGDCIVDCPPTFTMYAFDAKLNNGRVIEIERHADFSINVPAIREAVLREQPKAVFLASPNNPDGSCLSEEDLRALLDLPVLVVLDEAYQEFTDAPSHITWVPNQPNLVVLRTFSKCAALAGMRVGYGAFPIDLISYLWRAKQPYNVSAAAEVAACTALSNVEYMKKTRKLIVEERQRLYDKLKSVPFLQPYPSESNFILCKVINGVNAKDLKDDLYQQGILIRYFDTPLLRGYVRISVGKPEHTDALLAALNRQAVQKTG